MGEREVIHSANLSIKEAFFCNKKLLMLVDFVLILLCGPRLSLT